jgi:hypothetical protein
MQMWIYPQFDTTYLKNYPQSVTGTEKITLTFIHKFSRITLTFIHFCLLLSLTFQHNNYVSQKDY